jgi:hypothetical protein
MAYRRITSSATGIEDYCHDPGTSTNLKSTISTLFFLTKSNILGGHVIPCLPILLNKLHME